MLTFVSVSTLLLCKMSLKGCIHLDREKYRRDRLVCSACKLQLQPLHHRQSAAHMLSLCVFPRSLPLAAYNQPSILRELVKIATAIICWARHL